MPNLALQFTAASSQRAASGYPPVISGAQHWAWGTWIKTTDAAAYFMTRIHYDAGTGSSGVMLELAAGIPRLFMANAEFGASAAIYPAGTTVNNGDWHYIHVDCNAQGGSITVNWYIDGVLSNGTPVNTKTSVPSSGDGYPLQLAAIDHTGSPFHYFNGALDGVCQWRGTVPNAGQIAGIFDDGPSAALPVAADFQLLFNEGVLAGVANGGADSLLDNSGNGAHFTPYGSPIYVEEVVTNVAPTCTIAQNSLVARTLTVTPTATDPDGDETITDITVTWGDGDDTPGCTNGAQVAHTFDAAGGTFGVYAVATDDGALTDQSETLTVVVDPNDSPGVSFVVEQDWADVTLTPSCSDADGTIANIDIDWGDSNSDLAVTNNAPIEHTYATTGTYLIAVTATDNEGGEGSQSLLVVVATDAADIVPRVAGTRLSPSRQIASNAEATATLTVPDLAIAGGDLLIQHWVTGAATGGYVGVTLNGVPMTDGRNVKTTAQAQGYTSVLYDVPAGAQVALTVTDGIHDVWAQVLRPRDRRRG